MRLASYWIPEMDSAHAAFRQAGTDGDGVAATIKASLDQAATRAARAGYTAEQVQAALYATVAWIDEVAMSMDWPGAARWRLSPLQRHYFATTQAGVGFFERLNALPEHETEVREVYALMLVAGFQGDFAHRPPTELQAYRCALLERVAQEGGMTPIGGNLPLFPAAQVPGAVATPRRGHASMAAVLIVLVPVAILLMLYVYLDYQLADDVADLVSPLTQG